MTISDVIWQRIVRMEEKLAESDQAYEQVDEPELIAAMETMKQLADECVQLARRKRATSVLGVVRKPGESDPD